MQAASLKQPLALFVWLSWSEQSKMWSMFNNSTAPLWIWTNLYMTPADILFSLLVVVCLCLPLWVQLDIRTQESLTLIFHCGRPYWGLTQVLAAVSVCLCPLLADGSLCGSDDGRKQTCVCFRRGMVVCLLISVFPAGSVSALTEVGGLTGLFCFRRIVGVTVCVEAFVCTWIRQQVEDLTIGNTALLLNSPACVQWRQSHKLFLSWWLHMFCLNVKINATSTRFKQQVSVQSHSSPPLFLSLTLCIRPAHVFHSSFSFLLVRLFDISRHRCCCCFLLCFFLLSF